MINIDPSNPRGIVWLASYPRSGNSWMRAFLTNLVAVQAGAPASDDLLSVTNFAIDESAAPLYEEVLGRSPAEAGPAAIAEARPKVHSRLVNQNSGLVLLRTHSANIAAFGVPIVTRDLTAGAIYIVRNPLDVAVSFAAFNNLSIDDAIGKISTSGLATQTNEYRVFTLAGSWSENVATWTAAEHPMLIVVRYEDMYEDAEATFGAVADHVRMKHTPEQLKDALERSSFDRLQRIEAERGFAERPSTAERFFRAGKPGQWQDALSPAQVERVVAAHRDQMGRFGYLP
jgi:hypothetical protein